MKAIRLFIGSVIFLQFVGCASVKSDNQTSHPTVQPLPQQATPTAPAIHTPVPNCAAAGPQIVAWNFDWDDNIAYLKTPILLYKKSQDCARPPKAEIKESDLYSVGKACYKIVTTETFTVARFEVGVAGTPYENYEVDDNRSFWYFRDHDGVNWFKKHVMDVVEDAKNTTWKGPSWDAFQTALGDEQSSLWTTVITARGHDQKSMYEAIQYLQSKHLIKYLPLQTNLHAVSNPAYKGSADNPSATKTGVMMNILDCMNQRPLATDAFPPKNPVHLWGFSDDDWGNYQKAIDVLSPEVAKGRWPHVKITLFYSGRMKRDENGKVIPHQVKVIAPDGKLRTETEAEKVEVTEILKMRNRAIFK